MNYDDIENEQRTVLLFDIVKVKFNKLEGYKIRRILIEDSVGKHQSVVPSLWDTKVTSLEVFNRCLIIGNL